MDVVDVLAEVATISALELAVRALMWLLSPVQQFVLLGIVGQ